LLHTSDPPRLRICAILKYFSTILCMFIIIISAERRPLLDIGLPQSSPRRSVLCCPHPAASRDLHQFVGPPFDGPTNVASCHSRTFPPQRPSVLLAMCPAHCHLRSAIHHYKPSSCCMLYTYKPSSSITLSIKKTVSKSVE
jgi:hypothetical protein